MHRGDTAACRLYGSDRDQPSERLPVLSKNNLFAVLCLGN